MSKRLFVATSFSGKIDEASGQVLPAFRSEIEEILKAIRNVDGLMPFCAIEHEGWTISGKLPEVGVENDLREIDQADALLALLIDQPSEGLQYEMGYASAQGKPVIMATPAQVELGYFNKGLANLERIEHVVYVTPEQLTQQIVKTLTA